MRLIFWILFALMTGVYLTMVFWSLPIITQASGGLMPFDLRPAGYGFEDVMHLLEAMPEDTKRFYLQVQHKLDSVFPALMAVVFVMAFQRLFHGRAKYIFSVVAVFAAGFDYLENAAVAELLNMSMIDLTRETVKMASLWTLLKSVAVTLVISALLVGLVLAWMRKRKALS